jgi:hypothetical protein
MPRVATCSLAQLVRLLSLTAGVVVAAGRASAADVYGELAARAQRGEAEHADWNGTRVIGSARGRDQRASVQLEQAAKTDGTGTFGEAEVARRLGTGSLELAVRGAGGDDPTFRPTRRWGVRLLGRPAGTVELRGELVREAFVTEATTSEYTFAKTGLAFPWRLVGAGPAETTVLVQRIFRHDAASGIDAHGAGLEVMHSWPLAWGRVAADLQHNWLGATPDRDLRASDRYTEATLLAELVLGKGWIGTVSFTWMGTEPAQHGVVVARQGLIGIGRVTGVLAE